jgi:hypothetical protein
MSLRLWVRIRDRLWGYDDAFVLLAGMSSVAGDCMVCLSKCPYCRRASIRLTMAVPKDGLGLHFWTLDEHHLNPYFRVRLALHTFLPSTDLHQHIYSTNVTYCASATFIKLAILFQYLRLFAEAASCTTSTQYRIARRTALALIALSTVWGLGFTLLAIFPCSPIEKYWNIDIPGKCIGWGSKEPHMFFSMFAAHTASNMFIDFLILLMPLPFLGMLRLAGKSKVGLITLFILGCM